MSQSSFPPSAASSGDSDTPQSVLQQWHHGWHANPYQLHQHKQEPVPCRPAQPDAPRHFLLYLLCPCSIFPACYLRHAQNAFWLTHQHDCRQNSWVAASHAWHPATVLPSSARYHYMLGCMIVGLPPIYLHHCHIESVADGEGT